MSEKQQKNTMEQVIDKSANGSENTNRTSLTRPGGRTARNSRKVEQATVKLMMERGYSGWSFKEVADAAGVSRSTLYRRWPSRAAMILAAIDRIVKTYVLFDDTGSLKGDLRATLAKISEFLTSGVGETVIIALLDLQKSGELPTNHSVSWAVASPYVLAMFERAQERGELPEDFDAEANFAMIAGALYYALIGMDGKPPDLAWVDRVIEAYFGPRI